MWTELNHSTVKFWIFLFVDSCWLQCTEIIDRINRLHSPKNQHERSTACITMNFRISTFSTEIFFFESTAGQNWNGPFLPLKKNLRSKSQPPAPPPVPPPWTCFCWYLTNLNRLKWYLHFGIVVECFGLWPCGSKFESYNGRIIWTGHSNEAGWSKHGRRQWTDHPLKLLTWHVSNPVCSVSDSEKKNKILRTGRPVIRVTAGLFSSFAGACKCFIVMLCSYPC